MSQGGGEKKREGSGLRREVARGRGLGRSGSYNGGRGPGGGAIAITGPAQGPNAVGASANSPRRHPVAPFKGEDLKGGAVGGGFAVYFQSVDTYGGRCLGWVSA